MSPKRMLTFSEWCQLCDALNCYPDTTSPAELIEKAKMLQSRRVELARRLHKLQAATKATEPPEPPEGE